MTSNYRQGVINKWRHIYLIIFDTPFFIVMLRPKYCRYKILDTFSPKGRDVIYRPLTGKKKL